MRIHSGELTKQKKTYNQITEVKRHIEDGLTVVFVSVNFRNWNHLFHLERYKCKEISAVHKAKGRSKQ